MATIGAPLTLPFTPGGTATPGQGNYPVLDVYISFSDIAATSPVWTWVSPSKIRGFLVSRTEGETGTATIVLDNRDRAFDPTFVTSPYYPNVRPLNRLWLREQFTGDTNDLYVGYAESYEMQWPNGGWSDAVVVVKTADEFKILALTQLPLTNPPRNTYQEVVAFDNPATYWTMDEDASSRTQPPALSVIDSSDLGPDDEEPFSGTPRAAVILGRIRPHVKKPIGKKAPVKRNKDHSKGKLATPPKKRRR